MRAFRLHEFTGTDGFRLDELPSPRPGPREVLVRLRAASLNFRDLLIAKGLYNPKLRLPLIPLSDGAGEVLANGPGAEKFKPGDRVTANFMTEWVDGRISETKARSALGGEVNGMLAEEVVLPEHALLKIPEHLGFEEASTLPCAAVTAWNALFQGGWLSPGQTVLTQGTGGVSIFALQFARLAGARVIATSSSDEKLERVLLLGATDGINYRTVPDWDARVLELTDNVGVDQVVEVGGAGTLPKSLRAVRRGGYVALIGILSGGGQVNPMAILMRNIKVQGIFVGSRAMFEQMNAAIAVNGLHPVIDRVFPFEESVAALKHLESGAHFGKVVIRI